MSTPASTVLCPNCQTPLTSAEGFCSGCGMDMGTLTLVLAHSAATEVQARLTTETPTVAAPRLGEFLVQRGLLTEARLQQALTYQKDSAARGEDKRLGEILLELGLIAQTDLNHSIVDHIVTLQTELRESNRLLAARVAERTAELEKAIARVNEINDLKVNFISNISHELRTPLTHIQGYIFMLNDGMLGALSPQQIGATQTASEAVEQLKRLIDNLVRFITAARGELAITVDTFSLFDLAHSVIQHSVDKAKEHSLRLDLGGLESPIAVQGDAEKLSWVLLQLVDNAIKFTPRGGTITLSLTLDSQRRRVCVAIHDTGPGVAPAQVSALFQPSQSVNGTQVQRTGLGLVMVWRILKAHEAEIKVESAEGQGAIFSFELPLA